MTASLLAVVRFGFDDGDGTPEAGDASAEDFADEVPGDDGRGTIEERGGQHDRDDTGGAMATHEGGCHCGAVRFRVRVDTYDALDCNCSICLKKGFLHLIVERDAFVLERGHDALSTYTFGTHTAKHHFCRRCGVHAFYIPRSHPDGVDVNVRALDDGIEAFTIVRFDGRNWEENVETIR